MRASTAREVSLHTCKTAYRPIVQGTLLFSRRRVSLQLEYLEVDHHFIGGTHSAERQTCAAIEKSQTNQVQINECDARPHRQTIGNLLQGATPYDGVRAEQRPDGDGIRALLDLDQRFGRGIAIMALVPVGHTTIEWIVQ